MDRWWLESWSLETGPLRTCCGIGRTSDGFAVVVLRGDTCVASESCDSLWEAQRVAMRLKSCYETRVRATRATETQEG